MSRRSKNGGPGCDLQACCTRNQHVRAHHPQPQSFAVFAKAFRLRPLDTPADGSTATWRRPMLSSARFARSSRTRSTPAGSSNHTTNDEKVTPRCSTNSRGKHLCSDLFHWKGQRPNGDCGDIIPCGWWVASRCNHASTREPLGYWLLYTLYGQAKREAGLVNAARWCWVSRRAVAGISGTTATPRFASGLWRSL